MKMSSYERDVINKYENVQNKTESEGSDSTADEWGVMPQESSWG